MKLLFLSLLPLLSVVDAAKFCTSGNEMCLTTQISATSATDMEFTVTSKVSWVAFGIGNDGMNDADIIVRTTLTDVF